MDRQLDLLDGERVLARDGELVDHFRRVGADDVRAEDLAVLDVCRPPERLSNDCQPCQPFTI